MNRKKQFLTLMLSLTVMLSMMPFSVFADNSADLSEQADADVQAVQHDEDAVASESKGEELEASDTETPTSVETTDEKTDGTSEAASSEVSATDQVDAMADTDTDEKNDAAEADVDETDDEEEADASVDGLELKYQTLKTKLGSKVIKVSGKFPEGALLQAVEVPTDTVGDITDGSAVFALDISIISGGSKYQPEEFGEDVQVAIENIDEISGDSDAKILHIKSDVTDKRGHLDKDAVAALPEEVRKGNIETEEIRTECSNGTVEFEAASFSVYAVIVKYTVDFYLFDEEYHIEGGTSVTLSKLFEELAFVKEISEVKDVEFSSPELLSVEKHGKDWVLTSLREFHTKELLTVTLKDDSVVMIGVMDKFSGAEGECGTCTWTLDADYVLTIKPTTGNTGTLTELSAAEDAPWHDYRNKISSIVVENGVKTGENAAYIFSGCTNLTSVDLSGLDTSAATNFNYMFQGCSTLKSIDLSGLDTSNVQRMNYLLSGCSNLTDANLKGLVTSGTINMAYMFNGCSALKNLDISDWNTENVTSMSYMFQNCAELADLDVSGWNTGSVTSMNYMFSGCAALTEVDITGWDVSNVTTMTYMFNGCTVLDGVDISGWNTGKLTNMSYMFQNCKGLSSINMSGMNVGSVTTILYMFNGCTKLASADLSGLTFTKLTDIRYLFNGCSKLTDVDMSNVSAPAVTSSHTYMFQNCSSLESIDLSSYSAPKATSLAYMFNGCSKLKDVDFGDGATFNTSKVTNMSYMFQNCSSLTELDLTPLTINAVTNSSYMFQNCSGLTDLKMTITKAGNSLNASYMLSNCSSLTDVDLKILQTGTNANVNYIFNGCSSLEKIDLTNINATNITSMGTPLRNCLKIREIKLGGNFRFKNANTGLIEGSWDKVETGETESLSTKELTELSMNGEAEGTYVLTSSEYTVILYEDGELVFTKGGEPEAGRNVVDTYSLPNGATIPGWNSHAASISKVTFRDEIAPPSTYYWFYGCTNLSDENITGLEKLDTKNVVYMTYMFTNCSNIKNLDVSGFDTTSLISTAYMFSGCTGLESLKIRGEGSTFETPNVTAMQGMFQKCSSLTEIDLDGFSTESATNLSYLFDGCSKLASLDLSGFNTEKVTNMSYMFQNCTALERVQTGDDFTGPAVTTTAYMFNGCTALADLDMSKFRTSAAVTNISYMFQNCSALGELDLSSFDTSKVTNMSYAFNGCSSLTSLDVSSFRAPAATNMSYMFQNCSSLTELNVKDLNAPKVTNASYMFSGCSGLTELDLGKFNTGTVAAGTLTNVQNMFSGCKKLEKLNIPNLNTLKATTYSSVLNCANLKEITIGPNFKFGGSSTGLPYVYWDNKDTTEETESIISTDLVTKGGFNGTYVYLSEVITAILYEDGELVLQGTDTPDSGRNVVNTYVVPTGLNTPAWYTDREQIKKVTFKEDIKDAKPTGGYQWFYGCSNLTEVVGEENLNTSAMTSMYNMFNGCKSLTALDVSEWDTANVTNMQGMFQDCAALTELDISSFVTAKVTNMSNMFNGCLALENLELGDLNTSNVTTMTYMFCNCEVLPSLDVSGLETNKVTNMNHMFYNCATLPEIKGLENFETSKVTDMSYMFESCNAIEQLDDIEDWDVSNVTTLRETFAFCRKLKSLDLSKWDTKKNTSLFGTFYACNDLTDINVATMDTGNVTTTRYAFYECSSIENIDVSGWDTSKVTTMYDMFGQCLSLKSMDISNFNLVNTTDMGYMFSYDSSLETVVFPKTDASKVYRTQYMFTYCTSLKNIDLSVVGFTNKLTDVQSMFARCEDLETVDLSTLDITNCTYFSDFFHDCTSLKKITLGENFKYKQNPDISGQLSNGFPSGIWLYDGDNTKYKATDIVKKLETGSMPGTFTKVADHSIQAEFPAQYKIGKIYKIDDLQIIRKRGAAEAIKEWNADWADDGTIWMKVDGSELDPDDDTLRAPYTLVLTFRDVVEDAFGNKFDLQLKYDNITLYQASEIVMSSDQHSSEYYHFFFRISKEGNICVRGEDRISLENESDPSSSPNAVYDLTLTITDSKGNPQPGHFIFSIYDLDISSYIDYQRRQAGDTETTTPSTERSDRAYGLYSEGIYLKDGFDIDTLTYPENTYLRMLGKSGDGKWDGYRITGTQIDSSSELTDVVVRGDASGSTFTWTGWSCEDFMLYKYQPEPVYFHKVDQFGNRIDGAKLELYKTADNDGNVIDPPHKIDEWITDSSKNADYSAFMEPGKYLLREVTTPDGYETSADVEFIIDTDYDVCDTDGNKIDGLYDEDGNRHPEMNIVSMTDKVEEVQATVKKVWDDADNQDGIRPTELKVGLSNGTEEVAEVTLNKDNNWTATVEHLPKHINGVVQKYTWTEKDLPKGYKLTGDSTSGIITTLTNTHVTEKTKIDGTKIWNDGGDSNRPDKIVITVTGTVDEGVTKVFEKVFTIIINGTPGEDEIKADKTDDNTWKFTVPGLDKFYKEGKEIIYTIAERTVTDYGSETTGDAKTGFTIKNTKLIKIPVEKKWLDAGNIDNRVPITVVLKANGTEVNTMTLSESNSWKGEFTDLPKCDEQGKAISYTIDEVHVDGSITTITGSAEKGFVIYNIEETEVSVKKVWDDSDNKDGIRPESLTVTLSNGTDVTLDADNDWTAKVTGLPKYDTDGNEIKYTWTEKDLPEGYALSDSSADGTVTTLTNTLVTEATVRKVWADADDKDGIRPASLTVTLSNGTDVTLNKGNDWTSTVTDLPKYDADGNEIKYTWTEKDLPEGYKLTDTSVDGKVTTLTNTHEPKPADTEILISKVDEDGEEISGAVFEAYKVENSAEKKLTGSDYKWLNSKGQFTVGSEPFRITGLKDGTYVIKEVKAPKGYTIGSKKPVTFTVKDGVLDASLNSIAYNVEYKKLSDKSHLFTITNESEDEPEKDVKTGDDSNLMGWITLLLLATAGIGGTAVYRRKRREDQ